MGGLNSFFSAPAPAPPSPVPFHAKLATAAKATGGHLGSAASAVHAHGTKAVKATATAVDTHGRKAVKATSAVAKAVSSGGGPVPVPDSPPPPTCGPIEASVSGFTRYTEFRDRASGCSYVTDGAHSAWDLPKDRPTVALPQKGQYLAFVDPSPEPPFLLSPPFLLMVIACLLLAVALRKPSSKEVPVEAKAPEVDHEEEARLKKEELAKHKAGAMLHVEKWKNTHLLSQKLRVISESAKRQGYLEEHLAETEKHVRELEVHGSALEDQLHKALELSHERGQQADKLAKELALQKKECVESEKRVAALMHDVATARNEAAHAETTVAANAKSELTDTEASTAALKAAHAKELQVEKAKAAKKQAALEAEVAAGKEAIDAIHRAAGAGSK